MWSRTRRSMAAGVLALAILSPAPLLADDGGAPAAPPSWLRWFDNDYYKISLDIRARMELAKQQGLDSSDAWTVRTRAGIGTKPWHGVSAFAEVESTLGFGSYWDVASDPNGKTPIADPEVTDLNRAWLQFQREDWGELLAKGGRQRIILDDARFVGNVGWRQNEQTYDSVRIGNSFGVDGLSATYAYLWKVLRIFGDKGPDIRRDFDSDSHVVNVAYAGLPWGMKLVGFAYLLDFDNSPSNSSNSYGFRLTGTRDVGDVPLGYELSYAYQTDAGRNPVPYGANYLMVKGSSGLGRFGRLELGYELLGSDSGKAVFVTPLATAHRFNGFADVFLDNGGPNGLQDLFVVWSPELPFGLGGFLAYHHFWSDEGGTRLGQEIDFVVKRAFGKHLEVLTKGAYFIGSSSGPPDLWRYTLELNFRY